MHSSHCPFSVNTIYTAVHFTNSLPKRLIQIDNIIRTRNKHARPVLVLFSDFCKAYNIHSVDLISGILNPELRYAT